MAIPIGSSQQSTATQSAATAPTGQNSTLDKDAFLKLLVAQLSHQDPTQPMQGTEFVTQLSQFTLVEQAMAQSNKLDVLSTQLQGMSANEAVTLVGKNVSIRSTGLSFDGTTAASASVTLGGASAKTSAQVLDSQGHVVRTIDLGARPAGPVPVTWDGRDDNGQLVAKGTYTLNVSATDGSGQPVSVSQDVRGRVRSVSFDKGYPEVQLDSGVTAPVSDLVGVSDATP